MALLIRSNSSFIQFIKILLLSIIIFSTSTGVTFPVLSQQIRDNIERNLALAKEFEQSFNKKPALNNMDLDSTEEDANIADSKVSSSIERSNNIHKSSNTYNVKSQETIKAIGQHEVNLVSGWNLISIPVDPINKSITSVLSSIEGKYLSVWAYGQSGWERYVVGASGNNLSTMEAGRGYWIKMAQSAKLTVTGNDNFNKAINLKKGWNLVGYNSLTPRTREEALLSIIEGFYYSVWTYENGQWKRYITGAHGNTLTNMEPWKGYWINVSQDCVWELEIGPDIVRPEVIIEIQPDPSTPPIVGEPITINVITKDNIGVVSKTLKVNNINVPLDQFDKATYTSNTPGVYTAVATATDEAGNVGQASREFKFLSGTVTASPTVSINAPANDSKITSATNIVGTASDSDLVRYKLEYSIKDRNEFIAFASGTSSVTNGILGVLDPSTLRNGLYDIKLTAEDASGNVAYTIATYQLDGEMKVGNFTLSFTDLLIPVAGIPIKITRTYDSRDKSKGDFGVGWKMEMKNIQLHENTKMGKGWEETKYGFSYALEQNVPHYITVTYPDGKVDEFNMVVYPNSQNFIPIYYTRAYFVAKSGTFSTLESLNNNDLFVIGSIPGKVELVDLYTLVAYDPNRYKLTMPDDTVYIINQDSGLETIAEPNGNTIMFGPNGITHSTGKGVTFTRDVEGRIIKITDPMGNSINYTYDFYGDLIKVTDRENFTSKYKYNSVHGLIEYINPSGDLGIRSEYDNNGRLISITNSTGRTINFARDLNTRQEVLTDFDGNVIVTEYDQNGNIVRVTDPFGGVTTHTYDANGNQTSTTNALGHVTTRTFDAQGNKLTERDPLGNTTTYTYNSANKPLTITDAKGNTTSFEYDSKGNLLRRKNALNKVEAEYTYDSKGNILAITDGNGATTNYEYDTYGNVTAIIDSDGNRTSYTYNANGDIVSDTDAKGNTVSTVNDKRGLFVQKIDALGNVFNFEYGPTNHLSAVTDPLGNTTQRFTDSRGNEIKAIDPLGNTIERRFDQKDNLIKQTDALGNSVSYEYDAFDRLKKTIYPDGSFTTVEYDLIGRPIKKSDANGNIWEYVYDAGGRNTKIIDPLGNETNFEYDAVYNLIKQTDALGNVFNFTYDALNNLIAITFPDGNTQSFEYDDNQRVIKETDALGRIKRFEYNNSGNITKVIDPAGNETIYTYDHFGSISTQRDAKGNTTSYEYNSRGLLIKTTYPNGSYETYNYDNLSNMTSLQDPNGNVIQMQYDALKRLTKKIYPDGSQVTYTYTATGKIDTITDNRGTIDYTYDNRDRVIRVDNPDGSSIRYTYDGAGNITSTNTKLSAGSTTYTTTYTYDKLNRLKSIIDPDGRQTTYEYDVIGNRTRINYPNGTYTSYAYDSLSRLTAIEHGKGATVLERYTYTLNAVGDRTKVTSLDGSSVEYTYDNLRRLIRETRKDSSNIITHDFSYTYDAVGNRLTKTEHLTSSTINYTYDTNDRLISAGNLTYTYDANGNTLSQTESGNITFYEYDYENRLIKVTKPGGNATNYIYDANGALAGESNSLGSVAYLVDANNNTGYAQILVEYNSVNKSIIVSYVYGNDLISQKRSRAIHFYHYDGNSNTRLLTDSNGNVTDRYHFDAFGILLSSSGITENRYLYSGERYDPNSGFYYLRARFYSPQNGRFITRDLLNAINTDPTSLHKYLYANANPMYYSDPSGQFSLGESVVVTAVINIVFSITVDVLSGKSAGEIVVNAVIAGAFGALSAGVGGVAVKQVLSKISSEVVKRGLVVVIIPIVKACVTTVMWILQTETQILAGTATDHPSVTDVIIVFCSSLVIEGLLFKYTSYDKLLLEALKKEIPRKVDRLASLGLIDVFDVFRKKGMAGLNQGVSISKKQLERVAKTMLELLKKDNNLFGSPSLLQALIDGVDAIATLLSQLMPQYSK